MVQTSQTLKIMFFSWDNFYSKQIQRVTHSKWSHVGIAIENKDSYTVYEALARGLVKTDYTKEFINKCILDGRVTIKQTRKKYSEQDMIRICDTYIGQKYDFLAILYIWYYNITKKALKYNNIKNVICSEFVARAGYDITSKELDFEKEFTKSYDFITPADIYASEQLEVLK